MRAVDGRAPIVVRGWVVAGACISVSMFSSFYSMPVVLFMVEKKLMDMFFSLFEMFSFLELFSLFVFNLFFWCLFLGAFVDGGGLARKLRVASVQ